MDSDDEDIPEPTKEEFHCQEIQVRGLPEGHGVPTQVITHRAQPSAIYPGTSEVMSCATRLNSASRTLRNSPEHQTTHVVLNTPVSPSLVAVCPPIKTSLLQTLPLDKHNIFSLALIFAISCAPFPDMQEDLLAGLKCQPGFMCKKSDLSEDLRQLYKYVASFQQKRVQCASGHFRRALQCCESKQLQQAYFAVTSSEEHASCDIHFVSWKYAVCKIARPATAKSRSALSLSAAGAFRLM